MKLTVTIPGKIDPALSPNARVHWRKLADAKQTAKNLAAFYLFAAKKRSDTSGVDHATYHIERGIPKGGRELDADNLTACCKAYLDGVAQALGVDDRHWQIGTVSQVRDPDGIGYLEITLEWEHAKEQVA